MVTSRVQKTMHIRHYAVVAGKCRQNIDERGYPYRGVHSDDSFKIPFRKTVLNFIKAKTRQKEIDAVAEMAAESHSGDRPYISIM